MSFAVKHGFVLAAVSLQAIAFPFALEANEKIGLPTPSPLEALSKARGNCGNIPCLTFDEKDQFVSTTGEHAYASPLPGQIRGPCPGLNAGQSAIHASFENAPSMTDTLLSCESWLSSQIRSGNHSPECRWFGSIFWHGSGAISISCCIRSAHDRRPCPRYLVSSVDYHHLRTFNGTHDAERKLFGLYANLLQEYRRRAAHQCPY